MIFDDKEYHGLSNETIVARYWAHLDDKNDAKSGEFGEKICAIFSLICALLVKKAFNAFFKVFWATFYADYAFLRFICAIYPPQRQNLLPTLEIITQNFQNFQKKSKFQKKFQNLEFFFQNFQSHKGAANDIKGAATSLQVNSKISIFNWELP